MLYAKDFRDKARNHLGGKWTGGKWSKFAVVMLIYFLIEIVVSALNAVYIGAVAQLIINGPIIFGFAHIALLVVRGEDFLTENFFDGFRNFTSTFVLSLLNSVFIFLWSLLLIVPGIIKAYAYSMSFYIMRDNPGISATDARKASIEMMMGNKWRLFCLQFSFIGWYLLSILTLGILLLWVTPYYETAQAEFYESIKTPAEVERPNQPEITQNDTCV